MTKILDIEIVDTQNDPVDNSKVHLQCIRCDKELEIDGHSGANYASCPNVYGGVAFRSSGQYGSRVLDCETFQGWSNEVQIILCDECIENNAHRIDLGKNKRLVIEKRPFANVPVEWFDYGTFKEMTEERASFYKKIDKEYEAFYEQKDS